MSYNEINTRYPQQTHKAMQTSIRIPAIKPQVRAWDKDTGEDVTAEHPVEELNAYVQYVNEKLDRLHAEECAKNPDYKAPRMPLRTLDITFDGEYVDLQWTLLEMPFYRIRRITGYLVGSLERFNNGKRAEEADRVKHGTEE